MLLVLTASCYSVSPNRALTTFLVWPLIKLYWLKSPRTQAGNTWRSSFLNFCERSTGGHSLWFLSYLASLPLTLGTGVFNILLRLKFVFLCFICCCGFGNFQEGKEAILIWHYHPQNRRFGKYQVKAVCFLFFFWPRFFLLNLNECCILSNSWICSNDFSSAC